MSNEIIFFDLPSRGKPTCWSLNPWKARLAVNFKEIPYKTEWTEYPDINPKYKSLGIPPNTKEVNPNAEYSIPAARLTDGRYIMDSLAIAKELEKLQPEPSLKFEGNDYAQRTQAVMAKVFPALSPIAMPRLPELILNEASQPYFYETRARRLGIPLKELAKSEKAGEPAWENSKAGIEELKALLAENERPYIQGEEASFADFILAGFWRFTERCDKEGDLFGRLMGMDGKFEKHYGACQRWLKRDD